LAPAQAARINSGLVLFYDFQATDAEDIEDSSGLGEASDLRIRRAEAVRRSPGQLDLIGTAGVQSRDAPAKLADLVRIAGEITVEVWIIPSDVEQTGPATILTISDGRDERNFILGQDGDRYSARFRTSLTDRDGVRRLDTPSGTVKVEPTHLVYTRDRTGLTRLYVDGEQASEQMLTGGVSDWEKVRVTLGYEPRFETPWLGAYQLVALYGRDLSPDEVAVNFRSGAEPVGIQTTSTSDGGHVFETQIAPLLSSKCLGCHDAASENGGLNLSSKTTAFAGGNSGPAIRANESSESLLWRMVDTDAMPKARSPLSPREKRLLRDWIDSGAEWPSETIDPSVYSNADRPAGNFVRRLTASEYIETVRSTLGVDVSGEASEILPSDVRADGFSNTAYNLNVDLGHVQAYAQLASVAVSRLDVTAFMGGETELDDDRIGALGKQILRSPLTDEEVDVYTELATTVGGAGGDFEETARYLIEAMVQSPRFIYRVEQQRGDGTAWPADGQELAARLSYTLWGAPPDATLVHAADSGILVQPDEVERQVQRMLEDPRAVARSVDFIDQWLNLNRLANLQPNSEKFPEWDRKLADDMQAETRAYFEELVWQQKRPLADLLNAKFSYLTPELAKHYGLEPRGSGMRRYDLAETPSRGGILTQGSVLTVGGDEASMVARGLFILRDLLFGQVGAPPPGLDTTPVPTAPGITHRASAMVRVDSPSCGGCHSRFEPLAFGLEKFDGLGGYHEIDEHGNQLREDGRIIVPGEAAPLDYDTSAEMMDLLAGSDRVSRTITRKLMQFAIGRPLTPLDEPVVDRVHRSAPEQGHTYQSLVTAIAQSDLVRTTPTEF